MSAFLKQFFTFHVKTVYPCLRKADGQREMNKQTGRQTDGLKEGHTDEQMDGEVYRQMDR